MSIAGSITPTQSTASTGASSTKTTASGSTSSTAGATSLSSLTSNYSTFLNLLLTQLKHQNPSSPMDTNTFTQELVQFSQVEQQIKTNSDLTSLITLTQANSIEQSSNLVGKQVAVTSPKLDLQNGSAKIMFDSPAAQSVDISIYSNSNTKIAEFFGNATAGTNTWTWDGKDSSGRQMPNGTYTVAVEAAGSGGAAATALNFSVVGTATAVTKTGANLQLEMGPLTVDFSAVQKVL